MIVIGSVNIDFKNLVKWFRITAEYLIEIISKLNKNGKKKTETQTKLWRNCEFEIQKPFNR